MPLVAGIGAIRISAPHSRPAFGRPVTGVGHERSGSRCSCTCKVGVGSGDHFGEDDRVPGVVGHLGRHDYLLFGDGGLGVVSLHIPAAVLDHPAVRIGHIRLTRLGFLGFTARQLVTKLCLFRLPGSPMGFRIGGPVGVQLA